ncbi:MAG: metallophosphoesterase [Planctomycetia bacterium]|nr:metallophosphoesterase [Planctomycetia bacterium]
MKNRRDFLKKLGLLGLGTTLPSTFARSSHSSEVVEMERLASMIPDWVDKKIETAFSRYAAWKGTDDVIVFPVVSDIHAARPKWEEPANFNDTRWHILFAQRAAKRFQADFYADLGDIGFDRDLAWKPSRYDAAKERLASQVELFQGFAKTTPTFFCMGNHDSGRAYGNVFSELRLTAKEYGEMFNLLTPASANRVLGPNSDYGFFDVPGKRCRVFFLNTSDAHESGYSVEQLQFLADHLQVPEGYCVVVLQHICLHPKIGKWNPVREGISVRNGAWGVQILEAFVQGEKGSAKLDEKTTLAWDFTGNRNTRLAGIISGHSHFDQQAEVHGVNHIITQSYGTISKRDLPENALYRPFSRKEQMLLDMVVIRPSTGEMRFFRIGEGDTECDRTFAMMPKK